MVDVQTDLLFQVTTKLRAKLESACGCFKIIFQFIGLLRGWELVMKLNTVFLGQMPDKAVYYLLPSVFRFH